MILMELGQRFGNAYVHAQFVVAHDKTTSCSREPSFVFSYLELRPTGQHIILVVYICHVQTVVVLQQQ